MRLVVGFQHEETKEIVTTICIPPTMIARVCAYNSTGLHRIAHAWCTPPTQMERARTGRPVCTHAQQVQPPMCVPVHAHAYACVRERTRTHAQTYHL